jgi:hypothetical protein
MRKAVPLVLFLLVSLIPSASPQSAPGPVPPFIAAGMAAYRDEGLEAAMKIWLKNTPQGFSEGDVSNANLLNLVSDQYRFGKFRQFEVASVRQIAPSTRIYYLVLNYDNGPVFARFIVYRTPDHGWILNSYKFDINMDAIIPVTP